MSRVLHSISANNTIAAILHHDLIAFVQTVRHLIKITTSYQKEISGWHLHALEVVREVAMVVNGVLHQSLSLEDIFMDKL